MKNAFPVALAAAVALAGCGGDEPASQRSAPARVTPVPTAEGPLPTPEHGIHETPTATATAAATATPAATATAAPETGGAEAGDEEGIRVPVPVVVRDGRIRVPGAPVPPFLPLRLSVANGLDREVAVVVLRADGDGEPLARLNVPARATRSADLAPIKPGRIEIMSPDLGPEATVEVEVAAG